MLYSAKFRNNSPFSSKEKLDFNELQDTKLTKQGDFHKRGAADVIFIFKERLMR